MFSRRGLLFIAAALVLGVGAAWLALRVTPEAVPSAPRPVETVPVVVARVDVSVADTLTATQLDTVQWPKQFVPAGAISTTEAATGRVLRRPVLTGEPLLESALFPSGSAGGLGALITPEYRAISVKVDNVIGVAGFVHPGARVDVLATLRRIDQKDALPYSKVILQDVRVLAVDQQLEQAGASEPVTVSVATIEVKPEDAQRLIYAAHEGRLQLALRTPGDVANVETRSVGVRDVLGDQRPAAAPRRVGSRSSSSVQVVRGSKVELKSF